MILTEPDLMRWGERIGVEVERHLSSTEIRRVGILNEHTARREMEAFYRYGGGRAEKIMLMLNFQMWAERWL